jgi:transposase
MTNAMLDARQEGDSYRRIEVITGQSRRRRWTAEEKARIVAESFETDANISEVARRNGVARGLLTAWRHRFATAARGKVPSFVPVLMLRRAVAGQPGSWTVLRRRRRGCWRRHHRRANFLG